MQMYFERRMVLIVEGFPRGRSRSREQSYMFLEALARCRALRVFHTDDRVASHLSAVGGWILVDPPRDGALLRELLVKPSSGRTQGRTAPFLVPLIRAHAATLEFVELNGMPYASEMPALAGALAECAALQRVVLRYCAGLARLKACPALRDVALIEHYQGERGFQEALNLLSSDSCLRSVESLTLYGNIPLDCDLRPLSRSAIKSLAVHGPLGGKFVDRVRCLSCLESLILGKGSSLTFQAIDDIISVSPRLKLFKMVYRSRTVLTILP